MTQEEKHFNLQREYDEKLFTPRIKSYLKMMPKASEQL